MKFQAFHVNPGEKLKKKDVNNDLSHFMSVFPSPHHPQRKFLKDSYTYNSSLNITLNRKISFSKCVQNWYRIIVLTLFYGFDNIACSISIPCCCTIIQVLAHSGIGFHVVSSVCVCFGVKKKNHASIISTCAMKYRPLLHHLKSLAKAEFAIIGN